MSHNLIGLEYAFWMNRDTHQAAISIAWFFCTLQLSEYYCTKADDLIPVHTGEYKVCDVAVGMLANDLMLTFAGPDHQCHNMLIGNSSTEHHGFARQWEDLKIILSGMVALDYASYSSEYEQRVKEQERLFYANVNWVELAANIINLAGWSHRKLRDARAGLL